MIDVFQPPTTISYSAPMVRISLNTIIGKKITTAVFAYIVGFYEIIWLMCFGKYRKRVFKKVETIVHVRILYDNQNLKYARNQILY